MKLCIDFLVYDLYIVIRWLSYLHTRHNLVVARRVAANETISYDGVTLRVELKRSMQSINKQHSLMMTSSDPNYEKKLDIEVTGIPENTPEEFVGLFFESKQSCGGTIEKMNFDPETGTAVISFKDKPGLGLESVVLQL